MLKLLLQNIAIRWQEWRSRVAQRKRTIIIHEQIERWYRRDW